LKQQTCQELNFFSYKQYITSQNAVHDLACSIKVPQTSMTQEN